MLRHGVGPAKAVLCVLIASGPLHQGPSPRMSRRPRPEWGWELPSCNIQANGESNAKATGPAVLGNDSSRRLENLARWGSRGEEREELERSQDLSLGQS